MPDIRDEIVDLVKKWREKALMPISKLLNLIGISRGKYSDWSLRYGSINLNNHNLPRDFYLNEWEKEAIIEFYKANPNEGYRRITFMMMDSNVVAVSPATTYRILKEAGLLESWVRKPSKKGKGFEQPLAVHLHWHIDIAYLQINNTFYFLCTLLDGFSRFIVNWDLKDAMTEADIEIIVQKAKELFPKACPRIISDNGPQFLARDFKEFIRIMQMTHVRTSPYYPQSNGKIERYHRSIKSECVRQHTLSNIDEAKKIISSYVSYYNNVRLHSAIGYLSPKDCLEGRCDIIFAQREEKLHLAREKRKYARSNSDQDSNSAFTGGL